MGSIINLKRGAAKVEFYQNINKIREAYNSGYVVYKLLFEYMQKSVGLKMSYRSFYEYAKKEFNLDIKNSKKETLANTKELNNPKTDEINKDINYDIEESMQEYMKNMEHIFNSKKRR